MSKKIVALLTASALTLTLLAGCGSAASSDAAPAAEAEEEVEAEAEEPEEAEPAEEEAEPAAEEPAEEEAAAEITKEDLGIVYAGIDGAYPPFCFLNDNDEVDGFEVAIMKEISEREGIEIECQITSWPSMFGQLDSGRIDTVAENITVTPERLELYNFSKSYIANGNAFLVKAGNEGTIKTFDDLAGKKIGVASSGSGYDKLVELQESGIDFELVPYDSSTNAYDVSIGRIDASFMDPVAGLAMSEASDLGLVVADWTDENPPLHAYAFVKDNPRADLIRSLFDDALTQMDEDGTLKALCEEYLGLDISHVE